MINTRKTILALLAAATTLGAAAQGEVEDYRRAFDASGKFTYEKVLGTVADIKWNEAGTAFIYRTRTADGEKYVAVDPAQRSRTEYATIAEARAAAGIPEPQPQRPRGPQRPAKHWMVTDPENEGGPSKAPTARRRPSSRTTTSTCATRPTAPSAA